jgi:hypothetical protein
LQRLRELERIRSGKEMVAAKALADEADRKRALEVREEEEERFCSPVWRQGVLLD